MSFCFFLSQIFQLYATIQQKESVICTGPSGSGKSTCLSVLSRALNRLNYLLFAPDHSKDELTTDRDFLYHAKHKLQVFAFTIFAETTFFMYLKGMLGLWSKILEHCFLSTCSRYFVRSLENSFLKLSMNSFNILEVIKHSLDYFLKLCLIISAIYNLSYYITFYDNMLNQQFLCICKI